MPNVKVISKKVNPIDGKNYSKIVFEFDAGKGAFEAVAFRGEKVFEKVTEGNFYDLEIKEETNRDGSKQFIVSPPPMEGGGGGRGKGGGGYRPNPNLDMVKTAATQASRVIETLMNSSAGDKITEKDVKKWTAAFFYAQKELYDAAEGSTTTPAPASNGAAAPKAAISTGDGNVKAATEPANIVGDDEDDLPF